MDYTATYSPEDNKLRLYSTTRLDSETYQRVKKAGFIWAPKQHLFVAPMWTPSREDLLMELCGEIGDEDTSLVDRAEIRADRFNEYSDKRADDAERAKEYVNSITDNIPFGQPILVGHHSERRARRDAEKIENGMRKAVKMWETSKYWEYRAKGALRHAKYKERPDVRARRIKGLEADRRKQERNKAEAEKWLSLWNTKGLTIEQGRQIANNCWLYVAPDWTAFDVLRPEEERYSTCPVMKLEEIIAIANKVYPSQIAHSERWIKHIDLRLMYEKLMLDEQGASNLLQPKKRPKQLPLCNYRAPEGIKTPALYDRNGGFDTYQQIEMTKAEYAAVHNEDKWTVTVDNSHRVRCLVRGGFAKRERLSVFLSDLKITEKPVPIEIKDPPKQVCIERNMGYTKEEPTDYDRIKESLRKGINTISAPQLLPTPPEIAAKMVECADIEQGNTILEPSAGTGNLLSAIQVCTIPKAGEITAVEINSNLAANLQNRYGWVKTICADFLEIEPAKEGECGLAIKMLPQSFYDRIIMNPPFENGADIKHIKHAKTFLKPGGRLVALCANGPRQQAAFKDIADYWEVLPAGSFRNQGTNVNVAMMVLSAAS